MAAAGLDLQAVRSDRGQQSEVQQLLADEDALAVQVVFDVVELARIFVARAALVVFDPPLPALSRLLSLFLARALQRLAVQWLD